MIPLTATIHHHAKLAFYLCPCMEHKGSAICSITTQHLITEENSHPRIALTLIVCKPDFRINMVI